MISHIAGVAFPVESVTVVTCAIVFPPHDFQSFRIAAGHVGCKGEFLAQTNLSARLQEGMSARSTAASRLPESSVATSPEFKRVAQWRISPALVARLISDVKAENRLTLCANAIP
jgi:hypothetical protein